MSKLSRLVDAIQADTVEVPVWQLLALLIVAIIFLLARGSKTGLLITYIFALHIAFSFLKEYLPNVALLLIGIVAVVILLVGMFEAFSER